MSDVCHHISHVTQSLSKVPKHNVMIVLEIENDRSKRLQHGVLCQQSREIKLFFTT
jgi:hypothetical protein